MAQGQWKRRQADGLWALEALACWPVLSARPVVPRGSKGSRGHASQVLDERPLGYVGMLVRVHVASTKGTSGGKGVSMQCKRRP